MEKILISSSKFFFLITLSSLFVNAYAASWVKYGSDGNGDSFYVDSDSTKKDGGIIYFLGLRDLAKPEENFGSLSGTGKFKVDCSEGKTMLLAYNFYSLNMGKGELINTFPIREKKWFYPPKNTIGDQQIRFICNLSQQV